jgi:hypothetical protein
MVGSSAKKQVNFRLKDSVIKELQSIAQRRRISQADIVAVLIHWFYTDGDDVDKLEDALNTAQTL